MLDRERTLVHMRTELAGLRERTEALENELARIMDGPLPPRDRTPSVSRRDLLRQAGSAVAVGAAGAIGASLLVAAPVKAGPVSLELGRNDNAATAPTGLNVSNTAGQYGLRVVDQAVGSLPDSASLVGHANGSYVAGVLGFQEADTGYGVEGRATGAHAVGVLGRAAIGVEGQTTDGFGVYGVSSSGVGVIGTSDTGLGGQFMGKAAAIRLYPTKASTHPAHGSRGDLIVDKSGRLWFCKGGTNWTHVA